MAIRACRPAQFLPLNSHIWFCRFKLNFYICTRKRELSSAGSEHLPYKQGVTGSNPVVPTQQNRSPFTQVDGFLHSRRIRHELVHVRSRLERKAILSASERYGFCFVVVLPPPWITKPRQWLSTPVVPTNLTPFFIGLNRHPSWPLYTRN